MSNSEKPRGGLKVCEGMAFSIRMMVAQWLKNFGRVSPNGARVLKDAARGDAAIHSKGPPPKNIFG